jgi:DNA-binding NtrC family response regulator
MKLFDFNSALESQTVLIVENEEAESLKYQNYSLELGMNVLTASSLSNAIQTIDENSIDFAFCDLHLSTSAGHDIPDGLDVISHIAETYPRAVVIAMSSDPRMDMGEKALASGAQHFARKPFQSLDDFKIALRLASQRKTLVNKQRKNIEPADSSSIFVKYPDGIVLSKSLRDVLTKLATRPDIRLNLFGETGTGKEEISKIYHSIRSSIEGPIPFVAVNCAQLNPSIADSELFGHRKGSFTGANENTIGYVGEAHGGILFLDEIHNLAPPVQAKLLRVLNDGTYTRVGDTRPRSARFQLITASTKDLDKEALEGRFAMDLKMRIDGYTINLPALRDRKEDIADLLRIVLERNNKKLPKEKFSEVCRFLEGFYWAGNIRQFLKVTSAWILHCDIYDLPLEAKHIPIQSSMLIDNVTAFDSPVLPNRQLSTHQVRDESVELLTRALLVDTDLDKLLADVEKAVIMKAVSRHKTLGEACAALNLSRSTFDARRRKLGLA